MSDILDPFTIAAGHSLEQRTERTHVVLRDCSRNLRIASGNLPWVDVLPVEGANVYSILQRDYLLLSAAAIPGMDPKPDDIYAASTPASFTLPLRAVAIVRYGVLCLIPLASVLLVNGSPSFFSHVQISRNLSSVVLACSSCRPSNEAYQEAPTGSSRTTSWHGRKKSVEPGRMKPAQDLTSWTSIAPSPRVWPQLKGFLIRSTNLPFRLSVEYTNRLTQTSESRREVMSCWSDRAGINVSVDAQSTFAH